MAGNDIRTRALVLRRTNYGETDRILNILTPEGKMAVVAKGVRKEKSRLAGGIEMFSLAEVVVHQGRSEFSVLTSAKMVEFYSELVNDLSRMETAAEILKRVSKAAEMTDSPEYFEIAVQSLKALNKKFNMELVLAWFYFNLARVSGEQVNLLFDADGEKLCETEKYNWDTMEKALKVSAAGRIAANEIKMMRLMLTTDLSLILRVKDGEKMAPELLYIARSVNVI